MLICLIQIWLLFPKGNSYPLQWKAVTNSSEPSFQIHWYPHQRKAVVEVFHGLRYKRDSLSAKGDVKPIVGANNGNRSCCMGTDCYYPCPFPVAPMYSFPPPQLPVILPARTVYEPVIHNHPPPRVLARLIKADKARNRFSSSEETYSDTDSWDSDTSDDYSD